MVDFRKWLLALAVVGLLLGVGTSTANAQNPAFTCAATAVPNTVRSEGVTELLGDLILNCTGGVPTAAGSPIPLQNVVVQVSGTYITSRIVDATTGASEALLLIDEPYPDSPFPPGAAKDVTNPPLNQEGCVASNNTNCIVLSVGVGVGACGSYNGYYNYPDPLPSCPTGTQSPGPHYNVFQGIDSGANQISWSGVPIDAPGTAGTRIIRITNIRANANPLAAAASSLTPATISETISVNGYQIIAINQTTAVVANIQQGLISSVGNPSYPPSGAYQQCNSVNLYLLPTPGAIPTDDGIFVNATEGFRYAFRPQNYLQIYYAGLDGYYYAPGLYSGINYYYQDVLDYPYASESGFTPDLTNSTLDETFGGSIGVADHGTEIQFAVANVGAGINLYAPSYVYLSGNYGSGTLIGVAVLSGQNGIITNGYQTNVPVVYAPGVGSNGPPVLINPTATPTVSLVYEIYYADPSVQETLSVPISVEYTSNTASNTPPVTSTTAPTTVTPTFYPLPTAATSTTWTTATTGPVPRFEPDTTTSPLYTISACTCNLLFPFVTNQAGFDTGIAIANTTDSPTFGIAPPIIAQNGTVTLNYYGSTPGTTAGVAPYTTQAAVPAGTELVFTLSNGGGIPGGSTPSVVVPATAGFQGYIIAQANFQYCHGFAFISDVGAQKLAEGYLAISLDVPYIPTSSVYLSNGVVGTIVPNGPTGLNRTGNGGENDAH